MTRDLLIAAAIALAMLTAWQWFSAWTAADLLLDPEISIPGGKP